MLMMKTHGRIWTNPYAIVRMEVAPVDGDDLHVLLAWLGLPGLASAAAMHVAATQIYRGTAENCERAGDLFPLCTDYPSKGASARKELERFGITFLGRPC